jgi:rod shape-determining protein MreB
MVVDIGGGTTEIAVIALNGIVTKMSIRVGGDEMDEAIMNYAKKAYNMLIGEQTAERIKIEIGSAFPLPEEMDMEIKGRDLVRGIPRTLRVRASRSARRLQEPIGNIVNACASRSSARRPSSRPTSSTAASS